MLAAPTTAEEGAPAIAIVRWAEVWTSRLERHWLPHLVTVPRLLVLMPRLPRACSTCSNLFVPRSRAQRRVVMRWL